MTDFQDQESPVGKRVIKPRAKPKNLESAESTAAHSSPIDQKSERRGFRALAVLPKNPVSAWFGFICVAGIAVHMLSVFQIPVVQQIGWAGPLLATLLYPLIGMMSGWQNSPSVREKFADNCYYLGFIYTQVALIVGFIPMTFLGRELSSQDVLRAFSVALGASLIGLVVRTILIQTTYSVSENADIVEDEVEGLARAVSAQARLVLEEFERLGGRLTQTYSELNTELEQCVGNLVGTLKTYERALDRDANVLAQATTEIGEATKTVTGKLERSGDDLALRTAKTTDALLQARNGIEGELAAAIASIKATGEALARSADNFAIVPDFAKISLEIEQKVSSVGTTISTFENRLDQIQHGVSQAFESQIDAAAVKVSEFSGKLSVVESNLLSSERRESNALSDASAAGQNQIAARAMEFQKQVTSAAEQLEDTLKRFKTTLDNINV